jgi:hypothetical protein
VSEVDFSGLKRRSRLPPPPAEPSDNLRAPEHAPPTVAPEASPPSHGAAAPAPQEGQGSPTLRTTKRARHEAPIPPSDPVDGRSRRATGRIYPFATRVTSDFKPRLISLADRLECSMSEALEQALEALEAQIAKKR